MPEPVRVILRLRPYSQYEQREDARPVLRVTGAQSVVLENFRPAEDDYRYKFEAVYPEDTAQQVIYSNIRANLFDRLLQGFHCALFAYGTSSSGKTYSLFGTPNEQGVVPRLIGDLYDHLQSQSSHLHCTLKFSYFEMNDETIVDLLSNASPDSLKIRKVHSPQNLICIENLSEYEVPDMPTLEKFIASGNRTRAKGIQQRGVRWHGFLRIRLQIRDEAMPDVDREAELLIVHLKGSDRLAKKGVTGESLKEGGKINKSMSALTHIVHSLTGGTGASIAPPANLDLLLDASQPIPSIHSTSSGHDFVPYGNTKFTEMFRNVLGGNCVTMVVGTVSASEFEYYETLDVLTLLDSIAKIQNTPTPQEILTDYGQVKKEIDSLKSKLPSQSLARGHPLTLEEERLRQLEKKLKQIQLQMSTGGAKSKAKSSSSLLRKDRSRLGGGGGGGGMEDIVDDEDNDEEDEYEMESIRNRTDGSGPSGAAQLNKTGHIAPLEPIDGQLWKTRELFSLKHGARARIYMPAQPRRNKSLLEELAGEAEKNGSSPTRKSARPKEISTYKGEWGFDRKEGYGVEEAKSYKYEGFWKNGFRDGHGTLWRKKLEAPPEDEEPVAKGKGGVSLGMSASSLANFGSAKKKTIQLFREYVGEWHEGKRDGFGTMFYDNGEIYEGEWQDDMRHGSGKYFHKNGDVYEGEWQFDQRSGLGRLYRTNGDYYEGEWAEDFREGNGIYYYLDKRRKYEGEWHKDIAKCGTFSAWDPEDGDYPYGGKDNLALPGLAVRHSEEIVEEQVIRLRREISQNRLIESNGRP